MPTQLFECNGTSEKQILTVQNNVYLLHLVLKGAAGGDTSGTIFGMNPGGKGGQVSAFLSVVPGDEVEVIVGCKGGNGHQVNIESSMPDGGLGGHGYGKGGNGGSTTFSAYFSGGGGGGGTAVIFKVNEDDDIRLVAGGGGGAGKVSTEAGNGGYPTGSNGYIDDAGGQGGQESSEGKGGSGEDNGQDGSGHDGGDGANSSYLSDGAGGGGGGHYGGGGGAVRFSGTSGINESFPGGGGSSFFTQDMFFNVVTENGINDGDGSVEISYEFVNKDDITISSVLSPSSQVYLGTSVINKATVFGLSPGQLQYASITFQVFGHTDMSCQGEPLVQQIVNMLGSSQVESIPFEAQDAGAYRWKVILSFGGLQKETDCHDPSQTFKVYTMPAISSVLSPNDDVHIGMEVINSTTISGVINNDFNNSSVRFQVFGPDDASCETVLFDKIVHNQGPQVISPLFRVQDVGSYKWKVIFNQGDVEVNTDCDDASQQFVVNPPNMTTSISLFGNLLLGQDMTSTALISDIIFSSNSKVTFQVFGPFNLESDINCHGDPLFSSGPFLAESQITSSAFTAPLLGIYQWKVKLESGEYETSSSCEDAKMRFTIVEPQFSAALIPSQTLKLGEGAKARATVSDFEGYDEAVLCFNVFGPFSSADQVNCHYENKIFSWETASVGTETESHFFKPPNPGLYQWQVNLRYRDAFKLLTECTSSDLLLTVIEPQLSVVLSIGQSSQVNLGAVVKSQVTLSDFEGYGIDDETKLRFQVFGAFDSADDIRCQESMLIFDQTIDNIEQATTDSPEFIAPLPGFYQWLVTFEYNVLNSDSSIYIKSTECNDESLEQRIGYPVLTSQISLNTVDFGDKVKATVLIQDFDGFNGDDKATIHFKVFGPFVSTQDINCQSSSQIDLGTIQVTDQKVESPEFEAKVPGFYVFQFTFEFLDYQDPNNCEDPSLQFQVLGVLLVTELSSDQLIVGQGAFLKVMIYNMDNFDDSTMIVSVFRKDNCGTAPLEQFFYSGSEELGPVTESPAFFALEPGTYIWHVEFEDNEWIVTTECDDTEQTFVVLSTNSLMTNSLSSKGQNVVVGVPVTNLVVFNSSLSNFLGATLTFTVYGPFVIGTQVRSDLSLCDGSPIAVEFVVQNVKALTESPPFVPTLPGLYKWKVTFRQGQVLVVIPCSETSQWMIFQKAQPTLSVVSYDFEAGICAVKISDGFMIQSYLSTILESDKSTCVYVQDIWNINNTVCIKDVSGNGVYLIKCGYPKCISTNDQWRINLKGDERNHSTTIVFSIDNYHHYHHTWPCLY